jgi:hypothetical protein
MVSSGQEDPVWGLDQGRSNDYIKGPGGPLMYIVSFERVFQQFLKDNALVNCSIELRARVCLCANLDAQHIGTVNRTKCSYF